MNKSFVEGTGISPSLLGFGLNVNRSSDGNDTTNCHACLSSKQIPEINILSDCNINEIHLNIFPPSATYVKESLSAYSGSSQVDVNPCSFLNIDVHEKPRQKIIGVTESTEDKQKVSSGYFSHISLRRYDDSILNISIGNSSKITKRHKRNSWIFRRLWKFSSRRKSPKHANAKWFFSPHLNKDDIYRLSNGSLNFLNDELLISINRRNYDNHRRTSFDKSKLYREKQFEQTKPIIQDFRIENKLNDDADELDCYMDEIKRRENGMF